MIQWDTDLVQEYDTNVLVRCDRPDDYNKTVKFDLSSVVGEQQAAIVNTHPGKNFLDEDITLHIQVINSKLDKETFMKNQIP